MNTLTIPTKITKGEELIIISKSEYENFVRFKNKEEKEIVTENDVLRWSREARQLKKNSKLPVFKNLVKREYPDIAKKHRI